MAFDLQTALTTIAPTLATMLAGPFAGTAVAALEGAFGLSPGAGTDGITKIVQAGGITPDTIAAVRAADQKHAEVLGQQGIDLAKLNKDFETAQANAVLVDRMDARKNNSGRDSVWNLAYLILVTFAVLMSAALYGRWMILQGGILKDPAIASAISGLVGTIIGYVAANAQTVINFIYGGSLGSERKTDAMATAMQQAIGTAK